MSVYQITNAASTRSDRVGTLPERPEPGDIAENVGWDGARLYEHAGRWRSAGSLSPRSGRRYAGEPLFVGRTGSGEGWHVYVVQDAPGRYVPVAVRRCRVDEHGPHGHGPELDPLDMPRAAWAALDAYGLEICDPWTGEYAS